MSRGHWRQHGGKIELRVYVGRDPLTRKKVTRTTTIPLCGVREAEDALAAFVAKVRRPTVTPGSVTFGALVERWYEVRADRLSPDGEVKARQIIDTQLEPLAEIPLEQISKPSLDLFYAALRARGGRCRRRIPCAASPCPHGGGDPLAAATVKRIHSGVVRPALELAVAYGWLATNPAARADPGLVEEVELEPPEPKDVVRLLEHVQAHDPDFLTFVVLDAVTGARRGQLLAVRYSRIKAGELRFSHKISLGSSGPVEVPMRSRTKGGPRTVALGPATTALLAAHRTRMAERALALGVALPANAFVFSNEPDGSQPWWPTSTTRRFRRLCTEAGVEGVWIHALRHYVSTIGIDAGFGVPTVGARLGHSPTSTQTLGRYAHGRKATDQALAEFLEGLLGLPDADVG